MPKRQTRKESSPALEQYPLSKVYRLLEPGPVVMLTTFHQGRANIMTMSWHMMVEFEPPLIACVVSPADYSFAALRKTRQCVIAVPPATLAATVVDVGNCSGQDVDKFARFGLSALPAQNVRAPLIAQCLANLECRVVDTRLVNKYALFVLEVVQAWTNPKTRQRRTFHANGDGTFIVDGRTLNLKKRMVKFKDMLD